MGIRFAMKTKQEHSHVLEKSLQDLVAYSLPDVHWWRLQLACWGFINEELFKRKATESKVENQVGNWM